MTDECRGSIAHFDRPAKYFRAAVPGPSGPDISGCHVTSPV
jgi:hypothetical protein